MMIAPILKKLVTIYGAPQTDDVEAWLKEVSKLLQSYDTKTQEMAADKILREHRRRSFPHVSDIVGACADIESLKPTHVASHIIQSEDPVWGPKAFAAANKLIDCDMGKEAARDGWVLGLHEFARLKRRLPKPAEKAGIIETSRFVDDCAEGRMELGVLHKSLLELANSIRAKRAELATRVLDGSLQGWNPWAHPQQQMPTNAGLTERSRRMMGDE